MDLVRQRKRPCIPHYTPYLSDSDSKLINDDNLTMKIQDRGEMKTHVGKYDNIFEKGEKCVHWKKIKRSWNEKSAAEFHVISSYQKVRVPTVNNYE